MDIEISQAKNRGLVGLKGKIIDETKNTIVILTREGKKTVIKNQVTLLTDGLEISGKELAKRPEERIK